MSVLFSNKGNIFVILKLKKKKNIVWRMVTISEFIFQMNSYSFIDW